MNRIFIIDFDLKSFFRWGKRGFEEDKSEPANFNHRAGPLRY